MGNIFRADGPFVRFMNRATDLVILNIIFIISCLPIVTAGAAFTALHTICMRMIRNEDGYIVRGYWKAFCENFKQSTVIWLLQIVVAVILRVDVRFLENMHGVIYTLITIAVAAVFVVILMGSVYVYPLQARFQNTVVGTIKNAVLISILNFPKTLLLLMIYAIPIVAMLSSFETMPYSLLVGFALSCYISAVLLVEILKKYEPKISEE
ncbi:MAG: YesL family protein [Lachnospiraceae bacterium]|nr:YesL family protein [Lachnospiraceae bacterium]